MSACPNCVAEVTGRFCPACGQERERSLRVPLGRLVGEAVSETFTLDSKIARTLGPLLVRPGSVTRDYLAGKRARFTSPVKLYLLVSFLFFVVSALTDADGGSVRIGASVTTESSVHATATPPEKGLLLGVSEEELETLRGLGAPGRLLAARLEVIAKEPPEVVGARIGAAFQERVPQAMFVLLPVLAILLRIFYLRRGVYVAEHLVFALHAHAVAYLLLLPGELLASAGASALGLVLAGGHTVAAMRTVYGGSWKATVARAAAIGALYLVAFVVAFVAAALWAVLGS